MDFALGADLELLRRTARDFMAQRASPEAIRRARSGEPGYDPAQWREAEALGWTDLAGSADAEAHLAMVILAVETGRTLWPSPLIERLAAGREVVGALLTAGQLVGMSEAVLELTLAHVAARRQFGKPIGAFQAVRHRLADMSSATDVARVLTLNAAWALDQGRDAALDASRSKLAACRSARAVIMGGHQLHGGVGFAADHALPLYTVAARKAETAFGDAEFHLDRLEEALAGAG